MDGKAMKQEGEERERGRKKYKKEIKRRTIDSKAYVC